MVKIIYPMIVDSFIHDLVFWMGDVEETEPPGVDPRRSHMGDEMIMTRLYALFLLKTCFRSWYLDDVVVYSQFGEEHLIHLQEVLHQIKLARLTVNPKKCIVAHREVEYSGSVIGFRKIKPQMGKVDTIHSLSVPTTKKKVRGVLGACTGNSYLLLQSDQLY